MIMKRMTALLRKLYWVVVEENQHICHTCKIKFNSQN